MAIHSKHYKGVYTDDHQQFICDSVDDIVNLPNQKSGDYSCPTGSTAFVIGNGNDESCALYMLNNAGNWIPLV